MSCNYADGLSPYHDKGQLGLEEKFDSKSAVSTKVALLTKWINEANHVVVHTGAGISTSAGIPDFRGPRGVWTLQAKGEKPDLSKDFNEAIPTVTHMAIMKLTESQIVKYVVSQNIDGLHLRSNIQRKYLSELHGNMFTEQCNSCNRQFIRSAPVPTVGQKSLNKGCPATKANGRPCRGRLHDTILDWEHNLPENDLGMADYHSCLADLSICLGTTMQIVPSGNLPLYSKRNGGKLVIVNLQPTKHDKKANLIIHAYVDEVLTMLMKNLNMKIPKYSAKNDPTRTYATLPGKHIEWTISDSTLKKMKKVYEEKCGSKEAKKRLGMIYDDIPLEIIKNMKRKAKDDDDSDLEVLDVIVKPKRGRDPSKRVSRKNAHQPYNTTITIKKVPGSPSKKVRYEGDKITIKKNVTPTKTKYEIVTKPKTKAPKCQIVYCDDGNFCDDLDMVCESDDDDETTNTFTYNFKMYLDTADNKPPLSEIKQETHANLFITPDLHTDIKPEIKPENKEPHPAASYTIMNPKEEEDDCGEISAEIESVILNENREEDFQQPSESPSDKSTENKVVGPNPERQLNVSSPRGVPKTPKTPPLQQEILHHVPKDTSYEPQVPKREDIAPRPQSPTQNGAQHSETATKPLRNNSRDDTMEDICDGKPETGPVQQIPLGHNIRQGESPPQSEGTQPESALFQAKNLHTALSPPLVKPSFPEGNNEESIKNDAHELVSTETSSDSYTINTLNSQKSNHIDNNLTQPK